MYIMEPNYYLLAEYVDKSFATEHIDSFKAHNVSIYFVLAVKKSYAVSLFTHLVFIHSILSKLSTSSMKKV